MTTKKKPAGKAATKKAAGKPAVKWTRNRGKQPVADGVWVEVRFRSGVIGKKEAWTLRWEIRGETGEHGFADIMVWRRVRKPRLPKAEPVVVDAKEIEARAIDHIVNPPITAPEHVARMLELKPGAVHVRDPGPATISEDNNEYDDGDGFRGFLWGLLMSALVLSLCIGGYQLWRAFA